MPAVFRTAFFRFMVVYILLFFVAILVLGIYLYNATLGEASRQTDAAIDRDLAVLSGVFSDGGPALLQHRLRQRAAWTDGGMYMLIAAPSGVILAGNLTRLPPEALANEKSFFTFRYERRIVDAAGGAAGTTEQEARGKMVRFSFFPGSGRSFLLVVARDIAGQEYLKTRLEKITVRIALATLVLGILIGLFFVRSLLKQVGTVNRAVDAVRNGDLSVRIPRMRSGDELDNLGANLNSMLDRIERLMAGMREVSDNIAHDLRSPLTRIHNRLSHALEEGSVDREEVLRLTVADTERLLSVFNALLSIARIQAGESGGVMKETDLVSLAEEIGELYAPAMQAGGLALDLCVQPVPVVKASRELVSQAVCNCLDNALKYAGGGSRVELRVVPAGAGGVAVFIGDDGPGVDEVLYKRIPERFFRLEKSRTTPGSGLGLSLVRAIADAHGAALRIGKGLERRNGYGLGITILFPGPGDEVR